MVHRPGHFEAIACVACWERVGLDVMQCSECGGQIHIHCIQACCAKNDTD